MATRFYLESAGSVNGLTPARATWDVIENTSRRPMNTLAHIESSAMTIQQDYNMDSSADAFFCSGQWICVSTPLAAQTIPINTAWSYVFRCSEEAAGNNAFLYGILRYYSGDGLTLRDSFSLEDATEMVVLTNTARYASGGTHDAAVNIQAGDLVVFEIGYDIGGTGTDNDFEIEYGTAAASDHAAANGSTSSLRPWVEVDYDFVFESDGVPNQLMLMGCGL